MTGVEEAVAIGSLVVGAVGAGVSAIGAENAASAQSANANYQAQVAKNNQITAEQNARYTVEAGQEKALETGLKSREQQGAVVTALAANGLDVNTGSPADIRQTARETGVLETQRAIDTSNLQAYGYRTQSSNFGATAGLQTAEAEQAGTAGDIAAGGGLLAGASSVGQNYVKLRNSGAFGSGSGPSSYGGVDPALGNQY